MIWLAQPLLRLKLRRRGKAEPGYLLEIEERFGRYGAHACRPEPEAGMPLVWIHAVSLGETRAAAILLPFLRVQWPGMRLLLTHGTATGRQAGRQLLETGDVQVWQPWDTVAATRRFMRRFQPDVGLLMETEVWPNLVGACQQQGVPLILINARMSEKSMKTALRAGKLLTRSYAALRVAWPQSVEDGMRLKQLGAPVGAVLGNLKFDAQADEKLLALGRRWKSACPAPVIMLASSREGEENAFFQALKQLQADKTLSDHVKYLLVPRHPQRFDEVAELARQAGFVVSRRSQWHDGMPDLNAQLWIGDSLGEMAAYYSLADVALLGGSFEPLGGQNLIEAAACACPIVMGPHTFNFKEAARQALELDAALRVPDMTQGLDAALALMADTARYDVVSKACRVFAHRHQGAGRKTAQAVKAVVEDSKNKTVKNRAGAQDVVV